MKNNEFILGQRKIGPEHLPLVIAEVGINHEGLIDKAIDLIDAAISAKAECIKFQCHIVEEEMIPTDILPGNPPDKLWDIIKRCELTEDEEKRVKEYCDEKGIIYLCTPFSREAANRLNKMDVIGFKIGSGECNNYPLLEHIAQMGKPMILSTGMNDIENIKKSLEAINKHSCPVMLMHCTSMYPTPYRNIRLGALKELQENFHLPVGLSDHSLGNYTCLGAVALGACILEKHFTISKEWPGPDIPISIDPQELSELINGSRAVWEARGGAKTILPEEQPVIDFAYASIVAIKDIKSNEVFHLDNVWVKRPGTGEIKAENLGEVLGKRAKVDIKKNDQIKLEYVCE